MRIRVGTSGYSYKEWKGTFYPDDLPAAKMLPYYGERFDSVEINNTFYRMPAVSMVAKWGEQVPDGFTFVLKAPQRITHSKKLADASADVNYLFATAATLGPKQGPILFQVWRKLKENRTLFRTEGSRSLEKIGNVGRGVSKLLLVRDPLRRLEHEGETVRHLLAPLGNHLGIGHPVEGVVDLDGLELRGVERKHLRRGKIAGIETPLPFLVAVAARSGQDAHRARCYQTLMRPLRIP
jgi:hypothetical protein